MSRNPCEEGQEEQVNTLPGWPVGHGTIKALRGRIYIWGSREARKATTISNTCAN